jgi:uncharacterized protein YdcH (DUF465 family)
MILVCTPVSDSVRQIIVNCDDQGFWSIDFSGCVNLVIAVVGTFLAVRVFVYQRRKDREDKIEFLRQLEENSKLAMFNTLILEPSVSEIQSFYSGLNREINKLRKDKISLDDKIGVMSELDTMFNNFEYRFIQILEGVNEKLFESIFDSVDSLRDDISEKINALAVGDVILENINEIESRVMENRVSIIRELYNFRN